MKPDDLARLLGKRVAIQDEPGRYSMLILYGIFANGSVILGTSAGALLLVDGNRIRNPYMLIESPDVEVRYL